MGYAVHVSQRGLVNIHDCTFINFVYGALRYAGQANDNQPTAYAQGNQVYNNIMTDCGTMIVDGYSSFQATGQKDMLFHDNTLTLTGKPFGSNSEAMSLHHNIGMKVYNNTITTDPNMYDYYNMGIDMAQYTFVMELWDNEGGFEIYNNHFYNGALDIAGHYEIKGTYPYAVSVHNNTFSRPFGLRREAIEIEMGDVGFDDVLIYDNWIENYSRGINSYNEALGAFSNISIYYNVLNNIGSSDANNSNYDTWGLFFNGYAASTINNINIWNNTIIGHVGGSAVGGIGFVGEGTYTNISIKNNIIMNFTGQAPVYNQGGGGLSMNYYTVNNNDFYNNGNSNLVQNYSFTPTNYNFTSGNITTIPGFVSSSNFNLASGSGCINTGTSVGLTADYLGHSIVGTPDIGAYEYQSGTHYAPTVSTTAISSITTTSATGGGNITSDGGASVTVKGVCWSTSTNPTTALSTKTSDGTGIGSYSSSITGLSSSTLYYIRAYATNSVGTSYGSNVIFTTLSGITAPSITTTVATNITNNGALFGGTVVSNGGDNNAYAGVLIADWVHPTLTVTQIATYSYYPAQQTNPFTISISGLLNPLTTYYYRAYIVNSIDTAYGAEYSIKTLGYPQVMYYKSNGKFVKSNGKFNITH
jgi:hypothetical protein